MPALVLRPISDADAAGINPGSRAGRPPRRPTTFPFEKGANVRVNNDEEHV
jgi:hypothetical protein